ncbi:MAG: hypothetical protein K2G62_03775 [Oscillospiraceae bacterium]|nr:hypothetical protein [Oscillospiraceae bacterium]
MTKKKEESKPEGQNMTVQSEPVFSVERLKENCIKLFGVSQSTFDGAAYGLSGEYTVKEMKSLIEKWKTKEVK